MEINKAVLTLYTSIVIMIKTAENDIHKHENYINYIIIY